MTSRRGLVVGARATNHSLPQQPRSLLSIRCQSLHSSFLHKESIPSSSRKSPNNARESWFARRRRERSTRKKISTLALDHNSAFEADTSREQERPRRQDDGRQTQTEGGMTRRQRRLLFWSVVFTMPVWGRDIVESVVPGMLGIFILIAGKIKRGIGWVRSPIKSDRS